MEAGPAPVGAGAPASLRAWREPAGTPRCLRRTAAHRAPVSRARDKSTTFETIRPAQARRSCCARCSEVPCQGRRTKTRESKSRSERLPREIQDELFPRPPAVRSEEHTSELQSLMRISYAV